MIKAIIVFMSLFLVIGILFIVLSVPMEEVYNVSQDLADLTLPASEAATVKEHQANIMNMWWLAPFIMLIALIVWLFVQAQKREYEQYPY